MKYYSSPKKAKKTRIVLEEGWIVNRAIAKTVRKFEVLASKLPTLSRLYMYPYKNVVKREIELANLEPGARYYRLVQVLYPILLYTWPAWVDFMLRLWI